MNAGRIRRANYIREDWKKQKITIRVSFLSRASLNLCPGLLQSLQRHKSHKMEDRSNTSLRAKSTLSMLNFSLRLPIVWLVCMYALILFCLSQKKNYVLLLKISLCPEKPFFHILFSEIPLNLSPQLGCECWIWD